MFDLRRSTLTSLNRLTSLCHLLMGFTVSKREEKLLFSVNSSEHKSKLIEVYIIAGGGVCLVQVHLLYMPKQMKILRMVSLGMSGAGDGGLGGVVGPGQLGVM